MNMKTSLICGAALAILGVAAAPLIAQTQNTTSSTDANYVQASKVIGTKVKTAKGEEIGVVKDVVLERSNGCLAYTVLSTGGGGTRVTGQSKLVAVPWSVYAIAPDASYLTVNVDRDRIYNAPAFEYSHISDASYISNVYSHFGIGANVGFSGSAGTRTTTATTGATTQTEGGAYASPSVSPGASASVSPGASASPSASASVAPSATVSPSASADAKASASPRSGNRGRAKSGEAQTSSRHKGETSQGTNDESTSEGTDSSSGKKSSTRKSASDESSAESENTPSSKKTSHKKHNSEGTSETAPSPGEQE